MNSVVVVGLLLAILSGLLVFAPAVLVAILIAIIVGSWIMLPIYAWQTRQHYIWPWATVVTVGLFSILFYGIGPLIILLVLRRKAVAHATSAREFEDYRAAFLNEYPSKKAEYEKRVSSHADSAERERQFLDSNPGAVLRRAPKNAFEFEFICANWLRFWGESGVVVTQKSGDGGLDVVSAKFGAQVKFYSDKPVGRPEIQQLYGAASGNGLQPLFFAYSNGYTPQALEWAQQTGVGCFRFIPISSQQFGFEALTQTAADLALRNEGVGYVDYQEWNEMQVQYEYLTHNKQLRPINEDASSFVEHNREVLKESAMVWKQIARFFWPKKGG